MREKKSWTRIRRQMESNIPNNLILCRIQTLISCCYDKFRNSGCYSASHFSHFFAYLSRSCERSRMTNVSTTVAKNSDERLSFVSAATRTSEGKEAYDGAIGWDNRAFVCSSSSCAWEK